jgi:catechol 2,3-dioxygenase-like lactoylglutathione lyase family enzyme
MPRPGGVILVLMVEDFLAAHEELRDRGVEFLTEPKEPPWGGRRCFLHDPDGYLIEIEDWGRRSLS